MNLNHIRQSLGTIYEKQLDKIGNPYYLHPLYVEMLLPNVSNDAHAAALLHDVLEDTDYSLDSLKSYFEISDITMKMIVTLTHYKTDSYDNYINKIISNTLDEPFHDEVIYIKASDLMHNLLPIRMIKIADIEVSNRLVKKYYPALEKLLTYIERTKNININPELHLFTIEIKNTLMMYRNHSALIMNSIS